MGISVSKKMLMFAVYYGLILGLLGAIPYPTIVLYLLFFLFFVFAPVILIYFKKKNVFVFENYKKSAITGGILGFVGLISFLISFIPIVLILGFIFKNNYYNFGLPYFFRLDAIWLLVVIIISVGIVCASTNAVSSMGAQFFVDLFEKKNFLDYMNGDKNGKN